MVTILPSLGDDLAEIVAEARRSLVQVRRGGHGIGSGSIWHPDGLIVTNAHVVAGNARRGRAAPRGFRGRTQHDGELAVVLPDGRDLPAEVIAIDSELDLAALKVEADALPAAQLGDSRALRPGSLVVAVGHPWGVVGAASAGVVIDVGAPLEGIGSGREMVQVALRVRPGHSGGPLVDAAGRLVGINAMMAGPSVGMAVPVHAAKAFLRRAVTRAA